MRNERNYSGKDRDQLQEEEEEFNQVSHDFLQKGRWNVKKFKERKKPQKPFNMGFKLIFTTTTLLGHYLEVMIYPWKHDVTAQ